MRRILIALLVSLVACAPATTGARGTPSGPVRGVAPALVGTWELVSTRTMRGDITLLDDRPPTVRALKVLNGTHFSMVTLRGDDFAGAAAGRYRVVGDSYAETIELASGPVRTGRTYTFRIRVDGDTWTTDGGGSGTERLHEVWRRVP